MKTRKRLGFTLIEMVIVIVIVGILAALSGSFSIVMLDTLGLLTRQANLEESAMVALSRISRETRRLRNDQSVITATAAQFTFVDVNSVQITYRVTGGSLVRELTGPVTNELADNVTAFTITYFDDDGNPIATPRTTPPFPRTDIRRIEFEITVAIDTHTVTRQTIVRPRNLRHESYFFF